MRESRTYGSGRGACDETRVPTATEAAAVHRASRRHGGSMAARDARAATGDAGHWKKPLKQREVAMCKWQVIRGTKTVLAVLAILASVLAWGSAPVRADDNDGDLGRHQVRVLTQNMYVGASLGILLGATSLTDLINTAIPTFSKNILATKPDERAAAMAAEIAKQRPDFVALSEVWILTRKDFKMDLLQSLLDSLQALGQPYALVGGGTVNQEELDLNPFEVDFHLTDRNAILMRTDVDIHFIGVQSQQFPTAITLPPPLNQISPSMAAMFRSMRLFAVCHCASCPCT
jgi:hypothetical protein